MRIRCILNTFGEDSWENLKRKAVGNSFARFLSNPNKINLWTHMRAMSC